MDTFYNGNKCIQSREMYQNYMLFPRTSEGQILDAFEIGLKSREIPIICVKVSRKRSL